MSVFNYRVYNSEFILDIVFGQTVASGNNNLQKKKHRFVEDRWMGHTPKVADERQVSNSKNAQTLNAQIILALY